MGLDIAELLNEFQRGEQGAKLKGRLKEIWKTVADKFSEDRFFVTQENDILFIQVSGAPPIVGIQHAPSISVREAKDGTFFYDVSWLDKNAREERTAASHRTAEEVCYALGRFHGRYRR